jgi:hypothetical protein
MYDLQAQVISHVEEQWVLAATVDVFARFFLARNEPGANGQLSMPS